MYRLIYILHTHSIFNFIYIHEYMSYYFSVLVFEPDIIMPKLKQKFYCSRKWGKPAFLSQISVPPFTICALFTQNDFLIPKDWFLLLAWELKHGPFEVQQLFYCCNKWSYNIIYSCLRQLWKPVYIEWPRESEELPCFCHFWCLKFLLLLNADTCSNDNSRTSIPLSKFMFEVKHSWFTYMISGCSSKFLSKKTKDWMKIHFLCLEVINCIFC